MEKVMDKLIAEFTTRIAKKLNLSVGLAAKHISDCLYKVAAEFDTDFQTVWDAVFTPKFMSYCISKKCTDLEEEACYKSCHCAVFRGKCIPRRISNADEINRDPDRYIKSLSTKDLEELVEMAAFLFFNYEGGGLSDNSYDALEYHLNKRLKRKERAKEKVGAPPIDRIRTKLPYFMPSLNKVKPNTNELRNFLNTNHDNELVWSEKLDGVSGMVVYSKSKITGVYVRGDGEMGGDISYVTEFVKFPDIEGDLVVRGEFVIPKTVFQEKYSNDYVNERSFVTAKLNSGFISPSLIDIDFVAYTIITSTDTPKAQFALLESYDFKVPTHGVLNPPVLVFDLVTLYTNQRQSSQYLIDGIVLSVNEEQTIPTKLENPINSVAFKMMLEEQKRDTKVINVEWNISRHGRFVPVAIYESVYISDVRLHRASAFNAAHVRDWSMGEGTEIVVVRSGDVIPQIVDVKVDESIPPIYPTTDRGEWHWDNKDIVLDEIESNRWVQIKRNLHFFETIQVPKLREATLTKMWDADLKTIKDITNAKPSQFITIKGIGKKTSEELYQNIHSTMRKTRLDRFIPASTTFTSKIGRKLIIRLLAAYPTILEDDAKTIEKTLKTKKVPGFGAKRIEGVVESMDKFKEFLFELNEEDIQYAIDFNKKRIKGLVKNPKIDGKLFVMTGFMDTEYDFEEYIYDHGGDIVGNVTSTTEAVIAKNPVDISTKMKRANELGVKVYEMQEFVEMYDVTLHIESKIEEKEEE